MKHPLTVLGFGALASYNRASDVATGPASAASELPKLDLALLERTLRRSLSEVTRLFMHAAKLALDDAGRSAEGMHVIFASAFGEIATAEALLAEAYDANGSSPARFRNSVHNTAAGLLSISSRNQLACTAVAAGWETVAMALFEAAAQLANGDDPVLLVFAEERVPTALSAEHSHGPLAAAFVLTRRDEPHARRRGTLANLRRAPRAALDLALHGDAYAADDAHPLAGVLALAHALARGGSSTLALGEGSHPWCVDVHAEQAS
jgi:hypothetical protein